jgi:carbon storage regulator CsrA
MLVLTRKNSESVVIGGSDGFQSLLKVTVLEIRNGRVKLGFEGDPAVSIRRSEVRERIGAGLQPCNSLDGTSLPDVR